MVQLMDIDYGYGNGTKVRLDNGREGTIIGRTGIFVYPGVYNHLYIVEFKNGHGDYLKNEEGRFGECYIGTILVAVENITPAEVIE